MLLQAVIRSEAKTARICLISCGWESCSPVSYTHLEYLPVEQLCAMNAGQLLDFLDQGQRLLMGNKFRGLDAIHEELEFRQFKVPTCYIVAVIVPLRYLDDVQAKIPQSFNITIDRLALCGNIVGLQVGNDLSLIHI